MALVAQVGHIGHFEQYLVRALIYRAITDWIIRRGDAIRPDQDDPYLRLVEVALELCDQAEASDDFRLSRYRSQSASQP